MAGPSGEPPAIVSDVHAERAGTLFEAGQYLEAAQEFSLAFESTQQTVFLFAQAQALRRAGSCAGAIEVLHRYIASGPAEADQAEAQRIIEACEDLLSPSSDSGASVPAGRAPTEPPQASAPSRVRPVRADPWGVSLVGAGAGTSVLGAVLLGTGYRMAQSRLLAEAEYEVRQRQVRGLSTSGTVLVSVGAGLLIAGVVRYAIVARRRQASAGHDHVSGLGSFRW